MVMLRKKGRESCGYDYATTWIAANDETACDRADQMMEQLTVVMVADMYDRAPAEVAAAVIEKRRKMFKEAAELERQRSRARNFE